MFFKFHKERVIKAIIRNGLYIVMHVANGYYDKAFVTFLANDKNAKIKKTMSMVKYRITDFIPKQESLYKLMHC